MPYSITATVQCDHLGCTARLSKTMPGNNDGALSRASTLLLAELHTAGWVVLGKAPTKALRAPRPVRCREHAPAVTPIGGR